MKNTPDEPLVSVLIPTFRRPRELRKALESVIAQTYTNLEILVSNNDRENEETNALCREFAAQDKRIVYHAQQENIGGMANHYFLISEAKGEYCLIMNDDDWLSENYVELTLGTMRSDPKCAMAHGIYALYDANYNLFSTVAWSDNVHENREERILTMIRSRSRPFNFLCHTEHMKLIAIDKKARFAEDWPIAIKMFYLGSFRLVPGATYHKQNPADHDLAHYADFWNEPTITESTHAETKLASMLDCIVHDSFFEGRMEPHERLRLAALVGAELVPEWILKVKRITGWRCLSYLWRQPLALFKKKATLVVAIDVKMKRGRKQ